MESTPPGGREGAMRDLGRIRDELEEAWKREHHELANDCWALEDLIADLNFYLAKYLKLRDRLWALRAAGELKNNQGVDDSIRSLLELWLDVAINNGLPEIRRVKAAYGDPEGADEFRRNIGYLKDLLAPAEELIGKLPGFDPERLAEADRELKAGGGHRLEDVLGRG
jgi:hypothetical protein